MLLHRPNHPPVLVYPTSFSNKTVTYINPPLLTISTFCALKMNTVCSSFEIHAPLFD